MKLPRLVKPIDEASAPQAPQAVPPQSTNGSAPAQPATQPADSPTARLADQMGGEWVVDLERRRDQLRAKVAELQWDLGGLAYEMATRDRVRVDLLVQRAAVLQDADAELNEVERILRMEQTATAGACPNCGAPHSSGAAFCWQCGHSLMQHVSSDAIFGR